MGRVAFVFEGSLKALRKAAQQRLKPAGRSQVRRNCVASPASLFVCRSTALRQRALRPQLKRDPLGRRRTNVSRNHSLYARLDAVEAQFATRLLAEIASEAKGRTSMFLLRRMTPYFDGRSYRSGRVQKLETLYKDIRALKEKLRGPLSGGPVAIVKRFERLAPDGHF